MRHNFRNTCPVCAAVTRALGKTKSRVIGGEHSHFQQTRRSLATTQSKHTLWKIGSKGVLWGKTKLSG